VLGGNAETIFSDNGIAGVRHVPDAQNVVPPTKKNKKRLAKEYLKFAQLNRRH
jgi:hypothetical protein